MVKKPVEPFRFGTKKPLAIETVTAILAELKRRHHLDQIVRVDSTRHSEMKGIDAENQAWIETTTAEHGWIDAERFGASASNVAFLIVQHSGDAPLMHAALPEIERDAKAGLIDSENFALLFDRVQIMQGGKQRYGTQVIVDEAKGGGVVGRLEDPGHVDERRKAIGLGPLAEYLKGFDGEVIIEGQR